MPSSSTPVLHCYTSNPLSNLGWLSLQFEIYACAYNPHSNLDFYLISALLSFNMEP